MPIRKEIYLDSATTNAIAPHAARHPIRIPMEELHPTPKTTIYAATFSIRLNRCREKCGRGIHAVKPWAIFFPSRRVVRNQPLSFSTCAGHWLRRGEEVERVASTPDDISRGTAISKRVLRPELNADKSPRLAGSGKQSCPPSALTHGGCSGEPTYRLVAWICMQCYPHQTPHKARVCLGANEESGRKKAIEAYVQKTNLEPFQTTNRSKILYNPVLPPGCSDPPATSKIFPLNTDHSLKLELFTIQNQVQLVSLHTFPPQTEKTNSAKRH